MKSSGLFGLSFVGQFLAPCPSLSQLKHFILDSFDPEADPEAAWLADAVWFSDAASLALMAPRTFSRVSKASSFLRNSF